MSTKPDAHSCDTPNNKQPLLSVDEAIDRIGALVTPVPDLQHVALRDALGRILATDIAGHVDVPPYTNSAMDGYALRGSDLALAEGAGVRLAGQALAGHPYHDEVAAGTCIRIMTGAPVPDGTDTVIMQEACKVSGDLVRIAPGACVGQNVRFAGEDLKAGEAALRAGTRVLPAELGLLASLGIAEVPVYRRVRVAFFSTGDELCSIGETLREGCLYDSNRYTLHGMLTRLGMEVIDLGVIRDQPEAIEAAFDDAARQADVVITSGGVSVGDADYVKATLDKLGTIDFWRIAMKPGKPLACGRLGDKALFFGLPGNPVSVMVTFYQFVRPALLRLAGDRASIPIWIRVPTATTLHKAKGRTEFQRGVLSAAADGSLEVTSTGAQGSGMLRSMSVANCFIRLAADSSGVEAGSTVDVQPFEGVV